MQAGRRDRAVDGASNVASGFIGFCQKVENYFMTAVKDKAGVDYWDSAWNQSSLTPMIDPDDGQVGRLPDRVFHSIFRRVFLAAGVGENSEFIEVGCGNSGWLPYFANRFGCRITGIDYADTGCSTAHAILQRDGVNGAVHKADMWSPDECLTNRFDVVFSFGVIEHFSDTGAVVAALKRFAKSGGLVITVIPNMHGVIGLYQRVLNPAVYNIHVPLTRDQLQAAHEDQNLDIIDCRYLIPLHFGVPNLNGLDASKMSTRCKWWFLKKSRKFQRHHWKKISDSESASIASRRQASYALCVARVR